MQEHSAEVVDSIFNAVNTTGATHAELASALGIKASTVKTVLAKLLAEGRVTADFRRNGKRGRPAKTFKRAEG